MAVAARAAVLAVALLLAGRHAAAQDRCTIEQEATGQASQMEVDGQPIVIFHDAFVADCTDGTQLRANSGRLNRATRELHLVGDVFFQDSERSLRAAEATYNSVTERLWARGTVVFVDRREGSTLEGPELEYLRATEGRSVSQVTAGLRPRLTLQSDDPSDEEEPLVVIADRLLIVGDDDLSAFGSVVITRSDLVATSAESRYQRASESLELRGDAIVRSEAYELGGDLVQIEMDEGALEHVQARQDATLVGEDLRVNAPELQLFFAADSLRRVVARTFPDGSEERALALSGTFRMEADSLEAQLEGGLLAEVHAVGTARGETVDTVAAAGPTGEDAPDGSTMLASDWIRGDTIVGYFEPQPRPEVVAADSVVAGTEVAEAGDATPERSSQLRRLVSRGSAQSLYRMRAEDEPPGSTERRNVNFLVGDRIVLEIVDGELQVAEVEGLRRGVYLEASGPAQTPLLEVTPDGGPPAADGGV